MISKAELKEYIEMHLVTLLDDRFTVRITNVTGTPISYNVLIRINNNYMNVPSINTPNGIYIGNDNIDFDLMLQILEILKYLKNMLELNFQFIPSNAGSNALSCFDYIRNSISIRFNASEIL